MTENFGKQIMKMPRDKLQIINGLIKLFPLVLLVFLISGCGVQSGNEFLDIPENIPDDEISSDGPLVKFQTER